MHQGPELTIAQVEAHYPTLTFTKKIGMGGQKQVFLVKDAKGVKAVAKFVQIDYLWGVFAVLNKKSFQSENELARLTGLSKSYLRKILRDLRQIEAIEESKVRGFRMQRNFELPSPRIISIELKLDNWQKALVQATRHSAFATRSYVIMPANKKGLIERNIEQFIRFGISVGTFDVSTKDFTIIWKAPSNYRGKSRVSYLDSLYRMINSIDRLEAVTA